MTAELCDDLIRRVNAAACHGLLLWAERCQLIQDQQLSVPIGPLQKGTPGTKVETLLRITHWVLACLGVSPDSSEFWAGWQGEPYASTPSRDRQLGILCRSAPSSLIPARLTVQSSRQAAMYHCYQSLLLHPEQERSNSIVSAVDSHVDHRLDDVNLSEAVYLHHFRQPLNVLLNQLVRQYDPEKPLTLIDVGAGSGGMLIDVGLTLRKLGQRVQLVAIDPSAISRACCHRRAAEVAIPMAVFDGAIEEPLMIRQALLEAGVPMDQCLVLAKAALHDRTLQFQETQSLSTASERLSVSDLKPLRMDPVYRDHRWMCVDRLTVIHDMQAVLNQWRSAWPGCGLLVMESHLLPASLCAKYLSSLPLLPAYISHSLSAQYLLSSQDHLLAIKRSAFASARFLPIHIFEDESALMSISLLQS